MLNARERAGDGKVVANADRDVIEIDGSDDDDDVHEVISINHGVGNVNEIATDIDVWQDAGNDLQEMFMLDLVLWKNTT